MHATRGRSAGEEREVWPAAPLRGVSRAQDSPPGPAATRRRRSAILEALSQAGALTAELVII